MGRFDGAGNTEISQPAEHATAVTPSDTADLANFAIALYVGTGGDVKVDTVGGETVTISSVQGGTILPIRVKRIYATGTTASNIVALW